MPQRDPRGWVLLALAVGSAASYGAFFLLPYYVNNLNDFPLEEVAVGMPDLILSPLVAALAAGWAGFDIWWSRQARDVRRTARGVLTVAFAAVTWAWILSPFGGALIGWMLD